MSDSVELLRKVVSLKKGGEVREQQETAVREIHDALESDTNLLLEAPTGAGKTLSYMIPLIQNETRAVVSTATKQLSEQIYLEDIPFLRGALKKLGSHLPVSAALLKGRDNYLCLAKLEQMNSMEKEASSMLFGLEDASPAEGGPSITASQRGRESKSVVDWADETNTGDRTEAPTVSDETWRQYSSSNTECPGKSVCPFGEQCFAEIARTRAKDASVVVTNHAIVAQDLKSDEGVLLGEREVFVFDEIHELDSYLSSAWGTELTPKKLRDAHKIFKAQTAYISENSVKDLLKCADDFHGIVKGMEEGLIREGDAPRSLETMLTVMYNATARISADAQKEMKSANDTVKKILTTVKKIADELNESAEILIDNSQQTVRWVVDKNKAYKSPTKKKTTARSPKRVETPTAAEDAYRLHAAPLRVGPKLQEYLAARDAIMIGTSATITIGRKFEIPLHNFGLDKRKSKTVILDSPFDYKKQAMLYVPAVGSFPEPVGPERTEYTAALKKELPDFINAMGGRSLILTATSYSITDLGNAIAPKLKTPLIAQGDATNAQLVKQFKDEEETSLIGTRGFWHGLDAPGQTLSFVAIEKIPFKPMNDPLAMARREYADSIGRNGFNDIFVAEAETMLRQAFGRAIRSRSDKAVIACWDVRLLTKGYGRAMLNNLHGVGLYHDKEKVLGAMRRLAQSM